MNSDNILIPRRIMKKHIWYFIFLSMFSIACKSAPVETRSDKGAHMLGLDDDIPISEKWKDWTPYERTDISQVLRSFRAFDYWQVDDAEMKEDTWILSSSFLLSFRDAISDPEIVETLNLALAALEPVVLESIALKSSGRKNSQLDITFFASKASIEEIEGVLIRWGTHLVSGAKPNISFLLTRRAKYEKLKFDHVHIWIDPGFQELAPLTIALENKQEKWVITYVKDIVWDPIKVLPIESTLFVTILDQEFWKKLTGASYVEHIKKTKTQPPFLKALSKEIKSRRIEMVFRYSSFPPRFDQEILIKK